jgi:hypothetical protein
LAAKHATRAVGITVIVALLGVGVTYGYWQHLLPSLPFIPNGQARNTEQTAPVSSPSTSSSLAALCSSESTSTSSSTNNSSFKTYPTVPDGSYNVTFGAIRTVVAGVNQSNGQLTFNNTMDLTIAGGSTYTARLDNSYNLSLLSGEVGGAVFYQGTLNYFGIYSASTHYHVSLTIIIEGKKVIIPAGVGIANPQGTPEHVASGVIGVIHTHDRSGLIHFESSKRHAQYKIGDFFSVWGVPFTECQIWNYKVGNGHTLTMYVNGVANAQFDSYVPHELFPIDNITIVYS